MAWFNKARRAPRAAKTGKKDIPVGVWVKCEGCSAALFSRDLETNLKVCPKCHYHFRMTARERIAAMADGGALEEADAKLRAVDALSFSDSQRYSQRLEDSQKRTGLEDAIVTGMARLSGRPVMLAVMDFGFIGGSMGSVVGEKIARAADIALAEKMPLISFSSSGGARMQEGILSLMQMAKTSAAVARLSREGGLFISVLTNPTTGGVTASFAMLGDLILAEPGALVGFAGPRVIEQTIRQQLPKGFQTAEFVQQHGFVDRIVPRKQMKATLAEIIGLLTD